MKNEALLKMAEGATSEVEGLGGVQGSMELELGPVKGRMVSYVETGLQVSDHPQYGDGKKRNELMLGVELFGKYENEETGSGKLQTLFLTVSGDARSNLMQLRNGMGMEAEDALVMEALNQRAFTGNVVNNKLGKPTLRGSSFKPNFNPKTGEPVEVPEATREASLFLWDSASVDMVATLAQFHAKGIAKADNFSSLPMDVQDAILQVAEHGQPSTEETAKIASEPKVETVATTVDTKGEDIDESMF